MSELRSRTYHGALWSAIDAVGARFLQFVIGIILARLLTPAEFGVVGMLAIFIAVSQALLSSGFVSALIQKEEVAPEDSSSVFYFNIGISLVLVCMYWLTAPWVASFYGQPLLVPLARALSVVVIVSAFSVVQSAMLTRNMDFQIQTKVSLASGIGSGAIGIFMAYRGFGVWSLIAQQISAAVLRTVLYWMFNNWRPQLVFSLDALRRMFKFGSRILTSSVLSQVAQNIHYVVIGRLFSPAALGFYTRARQMEKLPSTTLTSVVSRVIFPAFSKMQTDDARLKAGLRKAVTVLMLVSAPVMIGLAAVAEPLVLVLLTDTWLPSVPYLQLLCLVALTLPLRVLNKNVLYAKGRSDLALRIDMIDKGLTFLGIAVAWRWGIMGLIVAQLVGALITLLVTFHQTKKIVGYGVLEQLTDVAPYLGFAFVMGAVVSLLGHLSSIGALPLLLFQIGAGVAAYLCLCCVFRPSAFREVWGYVRPFVRTRRFF